MSSPWDLSQHCHLLTPGWTWKGRPLPVSNLLKMIQPERSRALMSSQLPQKHYPTHVNAACSVPSRPLETKRGVIKGHSLILNVLKSCCVLLVPIRLVLTVHVCPHQVQGSLYHQPTQCTKGKSIKITIRLCIAWSPLQSGSHWMIPGRKTCIPDMKPSHMFHCIKYFSLIQDHILIMISPHIMKGFRYLIWRNCTL